MAKTKTIYNYTVFFEKDISGVYTVTVPSLPGLVTQGKDLNEAEKMAREAIECYVEGLILDKEEIPVEGETASMKLSIQV